MADKMTPEQRSKCMSKIRSRNTRPEMIVRRFLFSHGFRYRIHARPLPGTPDVVIVGLRTCIFINGCFWHGHEGCTMYRMPQTNVDYWTKKIEHNRQRDHETRLRLKSMGWHMVEVWECQLKPKQREETLRGLLRTLNLISLENHGARFRYTLEEDESSMAAEDNV
ncbi:MAG: very short patch repair endonuclease [Bacteroidales bacterium]|nr:very short patch repair endonuclease [Bacteroidales bacterium]MEE0519790.1 very short patch repair endonuclease [Bacteroidaceae bacterium]